MKLIVSSFHAFEYLYQNMLRFGQSQFLLGFPDSPERNTRSVMANVLDCNLEVSEFELPWRYYDHCLGFGKDMKPFIPSANSEII